MIGLTLFSCLIVSWVASAAPPKAENGQVGSSSSPNIIFIMLDDLGYADLSARGTEFDTPNLDSFYKQSIVINNHYIGLSVCSPSRSQVLTGRYAWNMGLSDLTNFGTTSLAGMPTAVPTLANLLKDYASYKTYALGKWHVGHSTDNQTPLYRGFDEFYGFLTSGISYTDKTLQEPDYDGSYIDWWTNDKYDYSTVGTYSTQVTADYINRIIDSDNSDPFYIYASFQAPHETLEYVSSINSDNCASIYTSEQDTTEETDWTKNRYLYCINIMKFDEVVGTMVKNLKAKNLWDNTVIVFTSDNGGTYFKGGCNYPLVGGKGEFFEGGVRTIAFVGGGYISSDQYGTERNGLMHSADWTPTLLSLAGVDVDEVEKQLQSKVYHPISRQVSLRLHSSDEYANDYLIDTSFDGIDLSQWLLTGDETLNTRKDVALSINSIDDSFAYDSTETSSSNKNKNSKITNKDGADKDGGDISIVFESSITGNTYKLIYLASEDSDDSIDSQACTFETTTEGLTRRAMKMKKYEGNKLLFDLTVDSTETYNLAESASRRRLKNKKKNKNKNKNKDMESDGKISIKTIADYGADGTLQEKLWNEAQNIILGYSQTPSFNDYLTCTEQSFTTVADPSATTPQGWKPFFTWNEYVAHFDSLCKSDVNDVLYELYINTYEELKGKNVENDLVNNQKTQEKPMNGVNSGATNGINGNVDSAGVSHMFGKNHAILTVGIIAAVSLVLVAYCVFYVLRNNNVKYNQYSVIGP